MIEEGLFARYLKPLLKKNNQKKDITDVLDLYIKTKYSFVVEGYKIKIKNISSVQKREIMLFQDEIEEKLQQKLSTNVYKITF